MSSPHQLSVHTSQHVAIGFLHANVGERLLAFLIDSAIRIAWFLISIYLLELLDMGSEWIILFINLPVIFYFPLTELIFEGQTPGKRALRIRVIKADGSRPGMGAYLLRWIVGLLERSLFFGPVTMLIIALTDKNQRMGDMAAGTLVVSDRIKASLNDTILRQAIADYAIVYPQVAMLSDKDARIIQEVFNTAMRTGNPEMMTDLVNRVSNLLSVPAPENGQSFINTILNDYNHYQFNH